MKYYNFLIKILRPLSLIILILADFYFLPNHYLGTFVGLIILVFYSAKIGCKVLPKFDFPFQFSHGLLIFAGFNSIILWISFYVYKIDFVIFLITLTLSLLIIEFLCKQKFNFPNLNLSNFKNSFLNYKTKFLTLLFLVFTAFNFSKLWQIRTDWAIASPWNLLNLNFFVSFAILSFILVLIILKNKSTKISLFLTIIYFSLFSFTALIVYKLGYGYDPFLHLSAMKEILANGFIEPKIFYYIGEYSLITWFHYLTSLSLNFLNQAFLPICFAILTPITIYSSLIKSFAIEKRYALLSSFVGLILPITFFINTTPQGLTNLLCLLIIFLSLIPHKQLHLGYLAFLGFITLTIHPLFGAPICLFVGYLIIRELKFNKYLKVISKSLIFTLSLIIFPLLFLLNSIINHFPISFIHFNNWQFKDISKVFFKFENLDQYYNFLPDLVHNFGFYNQIFFLILSLLSLVFIFKLKVFKSFRLYFVSALILLFNFLILGLAINFDFANNQNQQQFQQRIIQLAFYFLLPLIGFLLYTIFNFLFKQKGFKLQKLFIPMFIVSILCLNYFYSYPIKDNYQNTQEYNLTKSDIEAVNLINEFSSNNYIVLGNQMLAAGAISQNGFAKYYNGQFYYSIPDNNNDSLYKCFENFIFDKPNLKYIKKASQIAGVNEVYFVINNYWSNSKSIIEQTKPLANLYLTTSDQQNHIFRFLMK